jgi:hypothetical protein
MGLSADAHSLRLSPSPRLRRLPCQGKEVGLSGVVGSPPAFIGRQQAVRINLAFESIEKCTPC